MEEDVIELLVTCPGCGHTHKVEILEDDLPLHRNKAHEKLYTLKQLETILNLSRRTLKQLIYEGKLQASKHGDGPTSPWKVSESDLSAFRHSRGEL